MAQKNPRLLQIAVIAPRIILLFAACSLSVAEGQTIKGAVQFDDGSPVAGAQVIICIATTAAYFQNGQPTNADDFAEATTDESGKFQLDPPDWAKPPFTLAAIHDKGYGQATRREFAASPIITIHPWARIEGMVWIGDRPGAREKVVMECPARSDLSPPRLQWRDEVTADDTGKFVFERVPPVLVSVNRAVPRVLRPDEGSGVLYTYSQCVVLDPKPGETARVKLGGTGRPVTGRLIPPKGFEDKVSIHWEFILSSISLKRLPAPQPPQELGKDDKDAFFEKWYESQEGKKWIMEDRNYQPVVGEDGAFRAEDIPAGSYSLLINVHFHGEYEAVGAASLEFEVPEISGGRSYEPLDLGALRIKLFDSEK